MSRALLLVLLSWAAPAFADEPAWAGVPLRSLPSLGLGEPELTDGEDAWRAPVEGGGFVRLWWFADEAAAREAFAFQSRAAFTVSAPERADARFDESVGDGTGLLLVRARNVVLLVRDPNDGADAIAERLTGQLVLQPPSGTIERSGPEGVVLRDSCGRRLAR